MNSASPENPPHYDPYVGIVRTCLAFGESVPDRTGTGTKEMFGSMISYDLSLGFPLTTLKKTNFHAILIELLWLLRGDDHLGFMHAHGVKHWDPWIPKDQRFGEGGLGRVYGVQWRNWRAAKPITCGSTPVWSVSPVDQIKQLMESIRKDPHGRRHLVTCWNPGELDQMALPPCHLLFQCHVSASGRLSLQVYQRSADLFIGVPYDIGMYAILMHMMADSLGLEVGVLSFCFGSAHVYNNHIDLATEMVKRELRPFPKLKINYPNGVPMGLEHWNPAWFSLEGYDPHPFMKAPVAV